MKQVLSLRLRAHIVVGTVSVCTALLLPSRPAATLPIPGTSASLQSLPPASPQPDAPTQSAAPDTAPAAVPATSSQPTQPVPGQPAASPPSPAPAQPPSDAVDRRDPLYVVPGELRLDGLPAKVVESTAGKFEMKVCSYAVGHDERTWLPAPRIKDITVDDKTQLYMFGQQSGSIGILDADTHPYHVTVIGDDAGDGKPLLARVVWVAHATPAETAFVCHPRSVSRSGPQGAAQVEVIRPFVYTQGRNYPISAVQIKLSTVRVMVGLAWNHVGATETLGGIIHAYGAVAAINGSYFDAYVPSRVKMPDNELICGSQAVSRTDIGTVLGFTPDGEARMAPSSMADSLHRLDPAYPERWKADNVSDALFWQRVTEGVGAGPRLLRDGQIALDPHGEGYWSGEMLDGVAMRSAVGLTTSGWLVLVATRCTIHQLADIMRALGCSQAMNMDGGSSSGLWARGRYLRRPGRALSNALLIVPR